MLVQKIAYLFRKIAKDVPSTKRKWDEENWNRSRRETPDFRCSNSFVKTQGSVCSFNTISSL